MLYSISISLEVLLNLSIIIQNITVAYTCILYEYFFDMDIYTGTFFSFALSNINIFHRKNSVHVCAFLSIQSSPFVCFINLNFCNSSFILCT